MINGARGLTAGALSLVALALGPAPPRPPIPPSRSARTGRPRRSSVRRRQARAGLGPDAGIDQDNNGVIDRVAIDIIRPKESGPGLKVPAIIDDCPYYTSVGRGNETQYIHTTADGVLDKFPLFYDNYFVPRGYAVILAHANGTAFSTGCPLHGGRVTSRVQVGRRLARGPHPRLHLRRG